MVTIIHRIMEKTDNTLSYEWLILTRNACDVFWGVKCKNPKKGQTTRIRSFHLSDPEWTLHKHQLPWWLSCLDTAKNSPANAGDMGSTPGVGRSPGKGNGNPLQHSCLENSMDKETWWPHSQWSHKRVRHHWARMHTLPIHTSPVPSEKRRCEVRFDLLGRREDMHPN